MKYKTTIKQRLTVYKKMLNDYQKSLTLSEYDKCHLNTNCGFCNYLKFYDNGYNFFIIIKTQFPELNKFKPSPTYSSAYWWEAGSLKPRIKALEKTIKLTESLIKTIKLTESLIKKEIK